MRPGFDTEEQTISAEIVLLIQVKDGWIGRRVATELEKLTRLAGGSLFDHEVGICINKRLKHPASFLAPVNQEMLDAQLKSEDVLNTAINKYSKGGYRDEQGLWQQEDRSYSINGTGYALLEHPKEKKGTRSNYPHAFVESVHSLVQQQPLSENCWWTRKASDTAIYWE